MFGGRELRIATSTQRQDTEVRSIYCGPVRSSHSHFVKVSGLRWLCCILRTTMPAGPCRVWALLFMTVL